MREQLVRLIYRVLKLQSANGLVERLNGIRERQHLASLLATLNVTCVLDVGANVGQYARILRRIGYSGQIVSFEPNPQIFQQLSAAMKDDPAWRGVNCGLGDQNGELKLNVFADSQVSSFLNADQRLKSNLDTTVLVPVRRLDSVLSELFPSLGAERFFLKCDTQGFDLQVIAGAHGVLSQVLLLQSEVAVTSLYVGMPSYLEALARFDSLGFDLMDLWLVNRTLEGTVLEYDALLRKRPALTP